MMLYRADPFALLRRMGEALDRIPFGTAASAFPPLNLWQNDAAVAIVAQVPGVAPEDIEITVKDDVLTIAGQRRPPALPEGAVWHRRERAFGRFTRVVRLPFAVDPAQVDARFANGVLTIALQRPEEQRPRRIEIKAG
jgi:HSP20 family protein